MTATDYYLIGLTVGGAVLFAFALYVLTRL